eukprot:5899123-Pleurochrysis_carterae.AAC.3
MGDSGGIEGAGDTGGGIGGDGTAGGDGGARGGVIPSATISHRPNPKSQHKPSPPESKIVNSYEPFSSETEVLNQVEALGRGGPSPATTNTFDVSTIAQPVSDG